MADITINGGTLNAATGTASNADYLRLMQNLQALYDAGYASAGFTTGTPGLAMPSQTQATGNAKPVKKKGGAGAGIVDNAFSKGGSGWGTVGNAVSSVDSAISSGHGFDDQGEWGQAANGIFDNAASTLMKIPGCEQYGAALKATDFVGDLSAKMGLTTDGQTGIDQISQNGVGNLVVGTLLGNNLFTKKTSKFGADEEMLENMGGSYGGTANDIYAAAGKADKRYGWMSSHNRKKAQRAIDTARAQQNQLAAISKQNEQMHQMVDMMGGVAADAYRTQLMGGYDQSAMHVERGGRLEGKDYIEEKPMVEEIADPTETPVVVEIVLEQYDPRVPCPVITDMGGGCGGGMKAQDVAEGRIGRDKPGCPLDGPGQECPTDQIREKVVRDFMPEIIDLVNDVASDTMDGVMQKVRESAGRQMRDGFAPEIVDGHDEEADGPSCALSMLPPELARYIGWLEGGGPERMMRGGSSSGFSWSTGSSSSSVTRDMPGVGPVTVTRRSVMRPQVNVWAKGGKAVERQLDAPEVEESLQKNLIPEGALHRQRHHMDMGDDVTKKGIPVMDIKEDSGQEAEIERNEIIFNKEVTEKLEELYAVYYDGQSTEEERDQAAMDAGKLLTREIMLNTDDRTGLIDTLRRGGKVQDGGRAKYKGRGLDELVAYARERNPRFVQRLDEFPMILGFDRGNGPEYGTHLLSYTTDDEENPTKAWVYPAIMEDEEGSGRLVLYDDPHMAYERGDELEMTPDEAKYFTKHYKEVWNDYTKSFDEMEKYIRAHPDADPVMVRKMFMAQSDGKGGNGK